jgi:hypothetical protein
LYYYNGFEPFLLDFPLVYGEPNRLSSVLAKTIVTDRLTLLRKYNKTFDTHLVYDSFQCSTPVNLINTKTQRNSEGYWIMNNFRDYVLDYSFPFLQRSLTYFNLLIPNSNVSISKHWSKLKKFVDYWFINRFTYNNNWERVYVSNNSSLDPIVLIYYSSDDAFSVSDALRENELLRLDDNTIIKTKSILTNGSRMSYYLVSGPQPVDGQQYSKVERINNDLLEVHDIQGLTFKNYR